MSKAEKFIQDYTRNCSNELCAVEDRFGKKVISYHKWLTPDQARKAVEIAREEMIQKAVLHIIYNTRTVHYNNYNTREFYDTREFNKSSLDDIINDLKQAMKDE